MTGVRDIDIKTSREKFKLYTKYRLFIQKAKLKNLKINRNR